MKALRVILLSLLSAAPVLLAPALRAQGGSADQNISLVNGWNSVWLEVEPVYPPGHANAGLPKVPGDVFPSQVVTVLSPRPLAGTAEFFAQNPTNAATFNQEGWEQWHNPAGIGDDLTLITGNRPYLIQCSGATAFTLTGKVRFRRPTWNADRYNLVGFGLDGSPTFNAFFGPSGGRHPINKIYQLGSSAGNWQLVNGSAAMQSGRAYWVFSSGPSDYMGPVAVTFDGEVAGRVSFAGPGDAVDVDEGVDAKLLDLEELVFTNLGSSAAMPRLELVTNKDPTAASPDDLALYAVRPTDGRRAYQTVARVDSTPDDGNSPDLQESVASLSSATLTLGADRLWTIGMVGRTNLYRLKPGGGAAYWLPVSANNSSLLPPTDLLPGETAAVAGLWVGEVVIDSNTSIVEDGSPVRPSAGKAALRLLLHSDAGGAVQLLSQVTMMQTRSADPSVPAVPVLVVDPAKIPFFEGIKERNGKRVAVRLEAAAFDMPRDISIAAQAEDPVTPDSDDLIDMIVAESTSPTTDWLSGAGLYPNRASVDEAAIDSYLLFRGIRPPGLREVYELTLPLTGALGAGKTVRTTNGSYALDPFHRSNPFRHAFHQRHPKGPKITREIEIVFDESQPLADQLAGSFRETLGGLTKSNLTNSGRVILRRVSTVASLDPAP